MAKIILIFEDKDRDEDGGNVSVKLEFDPPITKEDGAGTPAQNYFVTKVLQHLNGLVISIQPRKD